MILQSNEISQWGESLDDFKPEYISIKAWNPIQFYSLTGKRTTIIIDNFEPIPDLHYALFSPLEKIYYFKTFRNIPLKEMLFYETDNKWDSYDAEIVSLRRYITDGNLWLLMTQEQVDNTSNMLHKLWNAHLTGEGKFDYRRYIELVSESLKYEHYKDFGKSLAGFKTISRQYEIRIAEILKKASLIQN